MREIMDQFFSKQWGWEHSGLHNRVFEVKQTNNKRSKKHGWGC